MRRRRRCWRLGGRAPVYQRPIVEGVAVAAQGSLGRSTSCASAAIPNSTWDPSSSRGAALNLAAKIISRGALAEPTPQPQETNPAAAQHEEIRASFSSQRFTSATKRWSAFPPKMIRPRLSRVPGVRDPTCAFIVQCRQTCYSTFEVSSPRGSPEGRVITLAFAPYTFSQRTHALHRGMDLLDLLRLAMSLLLAGALQSPSQSGATRMHTDGTPNVAISFAMCAASGIRPGIEKRTNTRRECAISTGGSTGMRARAGIW